MDVNGNVAVARQPKTRNSDRDYLSEVAPGYKRTEAGVIPESWTDRSLAELFTFKNGLNKAKQFFGFGTPIVNYMDVYSHRGLRASELQGRVSLSSAELKSFDVCRGDVFFTRTSETSEEIGITSVMLDDSTDTVFSGFVLRARPINDFLVDSYKKYCFSLPVVRRQITSTSSYTTRALTNGRYLSAVHIAVPPAPEQRAIAEALSDVDELFTAMEALIAKKRAIKQAAMQHLLTGKIRQPQFTTTAIVEVPGLGTLPADWFTPRLDEVCIKIQDGTHFSPKPGGCDRLYVTSRNVGFGTLDLSDAEMISEEEHRKIYSRCDTRLGDLLLTKDGANTGNAALNTLHDECSLLSSVAFMRFDSRHDDVRFFLQYILSNAGQRRLKEIMSGNAITRLTLKKIKGFRVPRPSFDEQQAIATVLSDMDAEITALEACRDKSREIKQGMMQQLLTGRIRLVNLMSEKTAV